jgi:hypothetical protein
MPLSRRWQTGPKRRQDTAWFDASTLETWKCLISWFLKICFSECATFVPRYAAAPTVPYRVFYPGADMWTEISSPSDLDHTLLGLGAGRGGGGGGSGGGTGSGDGGAVGLYTLIQLRGLAHSLHAPGLQPLHLVYNP